MNSEFDALIEPYFSTVPMAPRLTVLGHIIDQMADQVTAIGLYYNASPGAVSNRVTNVSYALLGPAPALDQ